MASRISDFFIHLCKLGVKLYKKFDPMNIYYYNYWIFVFCGFWKFHSSKKWKNVVYNLYQKSLVVIYGVSVAFFAIDAYLVRHDLNKLTFNMSSSVLVVMTVIKIRMLSNSRKDMEFIFERLNTKLNIEETEEAALILRKYAWNNTQLTVAFYGVLAVGFPLRIMADTTLEIDPRGSRRRGFLIPIPFQDKLENYYEYVYAQQVLVSFHFISTVLAVDLIGFICILRLIAHFEILEKKFLRIRSLYPRRNFEKYIDGYADVGEENRVVDDVSMSKTNCSEKMQNFLKSFRFNRFNFVKWMQSAKYREEKTFEILIQNVEHHQKLLKVFRTFSSVYSRPLLVQVCGVVILTGILVIHITFLSKEITPLLIQQLIYVGSTVMNVILLSTFGSELHGKSTDAAFALYDVPWYEMSVRNRKAIVLIIQRFTLAPKLKGGGMIPIDRVTCVKFLNSSYNMVAVLRNKL